MNKKIFKLAPLSVAIVLAGCSVAPKPLSTAELNDLMRNDRATMFADKPTQVINLTLDEAIDMAMTNNFELRQKMMEEAIANQQLDLAHYDMLPELVAAAGYTSRSNQNSSRSVLADGSPSSQASTSQDKDITTANLTTTWNVLDFGVSYYQAQQTADQTLIAEQRRRKIVHNLTQQVRTMYWNAAGAQHLQAQVAPLLKDAQDALIKAEKVGREQLMNPLDALRYRKDLLEIIRQLEGLRDDLAMAKPELAALLGLPPGTEVELAMPEQFELLAPKMDYSLEQMEDMALSSRPELIEANYQRRITALDTRKALVRMLPGLEVNLGHYYDSNSFLVNDSWTQGGLRVSWNLFNLLRWDDDVELAEAREELADTQRLALNMAVLSQVHVAYLEYQSLHREFERASELSDIGGEIYTRMQKRRSSSVQSRMEEIKTATSALTEELRMFRAYAGLQEAYGRIQSTLGQDGVMENAGGFVEISGQQIADKSALVAVPATQAAAADTGSSQSYANPQDPSTLGSESRRTALFGVLATWSNAWQNKDLTTYMAQYSANYPNDGSQSRSEWISDRSLKFGRPGKIALSLGNLSFQHADSDNSTVEFDQHYRSNNYRDKVRKTLHLKRFDGEWKIVSESARKL